MDRFSHHHSAHNRRLHEWMGRAGGYMSPAKRRKNQSRTWCINEHPPIYGRRAKNGGRLPSKHHCIRQANRSVTENLREIHADLAQLMLQVQALLEQIAPHKADDADFVFRQAALALARQRIELLTGRPPRTGPGRTRD